MMESDDLLKRVRRIEIKTRALTDNIFAGGYHSAFKGRGMSFAEVREYQMGDDVRDLDWNVTARLNRPHVKVFEEERELTVMLLVDVSGSQDFGTHQRSQRELVAEIAATLAFSAIKNNDKIGLIFFSDHVEKFIPPQKGRKHILYLIRELLYFQPTSRRTDMAGAVEFMTKAMKRRCICFLMSDFINTGKNIYEPLLIAGRKHDMIAVRVYDKFQQDLPDVGFMKVMDAETGHEVYLDTSSRKVRASHAKWWEDHVRNTDEILRKCHVDSVTVSTHGDYIRELMVLFAKRNKL
jgi:uncharacterized protein (DUF58 family)